MASETERRRQILEAAARLFAHYGPGKTTIADVAREAGVGVGTVYLEFPSKDAIVEELSKSKYGAVLAAMHEAAAREATFEGRLPAVLDARLGAFFRLARAGEHGCDLLSCGASSSVKVAHETYRAEELALVVDLIRRAARAREIASEDHDRTARATLRCYASFTLPFVLAEGEEASLERQREVHAVVLLGLLRRGKRA